MAGRGPAPKEHRQNKYDVPTRGDWQARPGMGWQHGPIPELPGRFTQATREAWDTWFRAWYAAHWGPEDLPMLRYVAALFNRLQAKDATAAERSEFRQLADSFGLTKKGQQDRRWQPPKPEDVPAAQQPEQPAPSRYAHLRAV